MVLVFILIVAFVIIIIWSANQKSKDERNHNECVQSKRDFETAHRRFVEEFGRLGDGFKTWEEQNGADDIEYSIAGINFRGLNESHIGEFDGYVVLEVDNPHDPYAVAIYRGRKKVGYIPKVDSAAVHENLLKEGGRAGCLGYIYNFIDEVGEMRFAGKIVISHSKATDSQGDGHLEPGTEPGQIISNDDEK